MSKTRPHSSQIKYSLSLCTHGHIYCVPLEKMNEDPVLTELKALVVKRRWSRNVMRTNLGGATHYRNGWKNLVEGVWSNTERGDESKIVQLCREMLGDHITDVCCNRNVHCGPHRDKNCLLYTSPSPRDATLSRMPSSA